MANQQITVSCNSDFKEILMAELAAIGYDSFQETDDGFITYSELAVEIEPLEKILTQYKAQSNFAYKVKSVEIENWNKKWEESYEPIIIDGKCIVRASFHDPRPDLPLEIIINPKMSFGTGHHETTFLMMDAQLNLEHAKKRILDAGCGTGILSILAGKLGASSIIAFDNDPWVEDNIQENFKINDTIGEILIGTIETLDFNNKFDIILANINKNILLNDIPGYAKVLEEGGSLLLSGFYYGDLADIEELANKCQLKLVESNSKNDWTMAKFVAF
jgi:ribosomal protein L11 methyltransferase